MPHVKLCQPTCIKRNVEEQEKRMNESQQLSKIALKSSMLTGEMLKSADFATGFLVFEFFQNYLIISLWQQWPKNLNFVLETQKQLNSLRQCFRFSVLTGR